MLSEAEATWTQHISYIFDSICLRFWQDCLCVISGFRREVVEMRAPMGYYAAYSGDSLPTFWDNLSAPSSRVRKSKKNWISLL